MAIFMKYADLVSHYERLEKSTKRLEKRDILSELYKNSGHDLSIVVLLSMGVIFPKGQEELGIAEGMVKRAIAAVSGASDSGIVKLFRETGDLGLTAERLLTAKKQATLGMRELTTNRVFESLRKLPSLIGKGSQEKRIALIAELLHAASPTEARYLVRTMLSTMRIGVAGGIVRDAIAQTFSVDPEKIEHLYNVLGDYGNVAEQARAGTLHATITVGRPVRVMLAERGNDLESAIKKFENPALEFKYDGFRLAIHKDKDTITLFSRRLENVTKQFPDIVDLCKTRIRSRQCIIEGEAVAVDSAGKPLPFQQLSRRIQRKHDIAATVHEIPVNVNLFDFIYCDNTSLMERPLRERWQKLKESISASPRFRLADHIETTDIAAAERFYKISLAKGQEGVIVKNLDAHYQPGKRVGYWIKIKPILEPLDLVVVGAEWGEGKRAKRLGSLILAARQGKKFIETGRIASGLTEQQLEELTKKMKPLILEEHGKIVTIKPVIVIEVGYEEIQKSPKYPSGYALRFPRLIRLRDAEKKPEDADTIATIEKLFALQKRL